MPQSRSNTDFMFNSKDEQDVFNILGIVYGSALFLGFMNCSILQPVVAMERVVLYREKAAGMYSTMAYAIAQVTTHLKDRSILVNIPIVLNATGLARMMNYGFTCCRCPWNYLTCWCRC